MSQKVKNKLLHFLHKKEVVRVHIEIIIKDLTEWGVFDDSQYDDSLDYDFLDAQAYWIFESNSPNDEKMSALKSIKAKQEAYNQSKKSPYTIKQEKRINKKIKELIENGVLQKEDYESDNTESELTPTRYGRSPLHEAIAIRDISLIEKYIKAGKYLDTVDNNGHTPREMAHIYGYKEACSLFKRYS